MFGPQVDGWPYDAFFVHVPCGSDPSSLRHLHWAVNGHQLVEADELLLVDRFRVRGLLGLAFRVLIPDACAAFVCYTLGWIT